MFVVRSRSAGKAGTERNGDAMNILVTGGTGTVGGAVVKELLKRGVNVRVLARKPPEEGKLPAGVEVAIGDLLDPASVEKAMQGIDKLFLLNAVADDELTQALIAYGIAKRAGVKHVTYLSVFKVEQFRDVPHFASKLAVENALREFGVPYTILRPGYYIQNDAMLKAALTGSGFYPVPIGAAGICAVDTRDIAEAAAISLTEEEHDGQTYDLAGPTLISGPGNAATWSKVLGKEIGYAGHNFDQWEQQMRAPASLRRRRRWRCKRVNFGAEQGQQSTPQKRCRDYPRGRTRGEDDGVGPYSPTHTLILNGGEGGIRTPGRVFDPTTV
jgi:uncharacterized protein YbjT (DUF2867 family)